VLAAVGAAPALLVGAALLALTLPLWLVGGDHGETPASS
jgi:hypothetical protein